jgi:6-pyruvoyl-tetrahydropterin synthase
MYALEVREHIMIAHSLSGEAFGPAQKLHGATYIVDVAFFRDELDENDVVVDIGLAAQRLKLVLAEINYRNLDDFEGFRGKRSTTEAVAKWIFDAMAAEIQDGRLGPSARGIERLRVCLSESHVAKAWYEAEVRMAESP